MDFKSATHIKDEISDILGRTVPHDVFDQMAVVQNAIEEDWQDGPPEKQRAFLETIVGTALHLATPFVHGVDLVETPGGVNVRVHLNRMPGDGEHLPLPASLTTKPITFVQSPIAAVATHNISASSGGIPSSRRRQKHRPLIGGISIGNAKGETGTLGYFCTCPGDSEIYVLSNRHVLVRDVFDSTDTIIQQGRIDGGGSNHRIGVLHREVKVVRGFGPNSVDAAIGKLDPGIDHERIICDIGPVTGIAMPAKDLRVRMHGRESGVVRGRIEGFAADFTVWQDLSDPLSGARFTNQLRIVGDLKDDGFGQSGDSGSLVLTDTTNVVGGDAVGLFFAASIPLPDYLGTRFVRFGLANPIASVLAALTISLV